MYGFCRLHRHEQLHCAMRRLRPSIQRRPPVPLGAASRPLLGDEAVRVVRGSSQGPPCRPSAEPQPARGSRGTGIARTGPAVGSGPGIMRALARGATNRGPTNRGGLGLAVAVVVGLCRGRSSTFAAPRGVEDLESDQIPWCWTRATMTRAHRRDPGRSMPLRSTGVNCWIMAGNCPIRRAWPLQGRASVAGVPLLLACLSRHPDR